MEEVSKSFGREKIHAMNHVGAVLQMLVLTHRSCVCIARNQLREQREETTFDQNCKIIRAVSFEIVSNRLI